MGLDRGLLKAIQDHKEKISGPHFLFSADNPKYPHKNELKMDHHKVLAHLKNAGYDAHEVQGHYGAPERSIAVYGVSPEHAEKLHGMASRLGQDSSIHSTGSEHEMRFHHGADAGKKIKGAGTQWHKEKPHDFFTTLPSGAHFTHNFGKSEDEGEKLNLIHYSKHPGLKTIDPKFRGTGVDAGVKGRDSEHGHSFFYREGTEPEHLVTSQAANKYKASISSKDRPLYDLGEDKHGHVKEAIAANGGALNMDKVHARLKEKGFHGFFNSKHKAMSNVVALYHPTDVEHHGKE